MAYPRINVRPGGHLNWGKLVKTWASGRDYVGHVITNDSPFPADNELAPNNPKPTDFAQLVTQCQQFGVQLYFDDGVNNEDVQGSEKIELHVVPLHPDTMILRLPMDDKLKESEARLLKAGETYKLPGFYARIHETPAKDSQTGSPSQKATLHAERVGEYTINTCM